jgi:hypothetical protein
VPARAGESAHVDHCRDGVRREERDEVFDRTRRVPDRVDRLRRVRDVSE